MVRRDNPVTIDNRALIDRLIKIAIPISIQGVVSATLSLVDTLMVGFLGETELAAVGIATQIFFIHYLFVFGFNSGSATFMAQFYGNQDFRNIRKTVGFVVTVAMGIGTLFFIVGFFFTDAVLHIYASDPVLIEMARPYVKIASITFFTLALCAPLEMAFKATQQTRIPLIISAVTFTTNTCLNYVLIFGKFGAPAMGVAGAATATAISRCLEVVVSLYFAGRKGYNLRGPISDYFGWSKEFVLRVLKNARATTANELLWSLGTSMYVAAFSRMGTTAYASYQAAASIQNIFNFAAFSVGDAALILIGQKLGEGDKDYAYALALKLLKIGTVVAMFFGGLLILASYPMVQLFALTKLGKTYAFRLLLVYGGTLVLNVLNGMCITGILRGGGDTRFAAITEISCIWLIAVPMAFASSLWWHLPIYLAVLCLRGYEVVELSILLWRIRGGRWLNTVITGL